jgi:uncharacterized protein YgiM (DUF1202 family)
MRKFLTVAALMGGMFAASAAMADNIYDNQTDTPGTSGPQVGTGMSEPMVVDVDNGNVREAPNAQAKILTTVPRGHRVMVVGTANGGAWAHVMVDGLEGYMDYVQLSKAQPSNNYGYNNGAYYNAYYNNGATTTYYAPSPGVRYMSVTSDAANVRQQPTTDSELLAVLPRGSRVTVVGSSGGWAHVQGNGLDGYMDYVQLADTAPPYGTTATYTPQPGYYTTYPYYQPQPQPAPQIYYQQTPTYQQSPTYQYPPSTPTYYQQSPTYSYQSTTTYYNPTARVVNGYGATIHQAPYADSSLVTTLPPGTQVMVVGSANGRWAHVIANGYDGYMDYAELQ